jgi:hypothetical protein
MGGNAHIMRHAWRHEAGVWVCSSDVRYGVHYAQGTACVRVTTKSSCGGYAGEAEKKIKKSFLYAARVSR